MTTESTKKDAGTISLSVGGEKRDLMFSAATRFRLFLDIPPVDIQEYILSDLFKINAVGMVLYGKDIQGKTIDYILDRFEEDGLSDIECEEIIGWIRERTLNFMLAEAQQTMKALEPILKKANELNSTSTGMLA